MKIGVLGAGTMGSGIAYAFAQAGHEVVLRTRKQETLDGAMKYMHSTLAKSVAKGKMTQEEMDAIYGRVTPATDLNAVADVDFILETIAESMSVKKDIFAELDKLCKPGVIFGTNTSSLSITEISNGVEHPVVGMHFFNPPPVMKLIEVIAGENTPKEAVEKVLEITKTMGKEPVEVKEAPGFVVNRILIPMINEAIGIFAEGVASVEGIDTAMKLGANHPIGPLALGDMIGLDVCLAIMNVMYSETGDSKYRPHGLLKKMVRAGKLGKKSGVGFYNYSAK
ncbi:MAG TPA: 3-hydroxyacyl-CoA dehydrogenase NAD-binding domain-containing protein [Clostridia bacterium]|nr:3-hydroxyacyl-CoA dehydrogenase NAD-binding domain-containing protein [Clostridia bacterium]